MAKTEKEPPSYVICAKRISTKQRFTKDCSIMGETVPISIQGGQIHVHREVLTSTSDFLKNAMKPEWRADKNRPIDLSEENPKAVEIYCQWLYSGKIACCDNSLSTCTSICQLYVLGEKLMDQTFKNTVLDFIVKGLDGDFGFRLTADGIKIIYEGTPKGSPARRLVVDICAYHITPRLNLDVLSCFRGTDFLEELITALVAVRSPPRNKVPPWATQPESYHLSHPMLHYLYSHPACSTVHTTD
ncbi:hypothetical protein COCC4DRAFT_141917 [Bipolaris maydis ATCC 48331]|uniref:BTB domain-containing protein n=2 Tax=Cochliobolus heterostrophus TaxID=5016 RepID=M2TGV5_COCH5|nr:uncharacterized protein COCC4DRAFT_141917 [Bipolaris maydis ATCC 48331]EMD96675.1 hypothetical protein COCHEDRAFT_1150373 [Bipolaris maydis C5]KAJ5031435.1 hypothetical protein J3E73DRAFT_178714 [Bipolaris maydis]ENI03542.1 hypothetical protein COCC4DRAFT_141917 [Bipolaris maydis ATCC 48331]KAJ5031444.1 hypothetical protein J3E73DRAFT_180136 [Bipolaris maydis]KAJ6211322.1 hypothetical protein PSV09DRAFT_1150373 [Bipolaris maydis]